MSKQAHIVVSRPRRRPGEPGLHRSALVLFWRLLPVQFLGLLALLPGLSVFGVLVWNLDSFTGELWYGMDPAFVLLLVSTCLSAVGLILAGNVLAFAAADRLNGGSGFSRALFALAADRVPGALLLHAPFVLGLLVGLFWPLSLFAYLAVLLIWQFLLPGLFVQLAAGESLREGIKSGWAIWKRRPLRHVLLVVWFWFLFSLPGILSAALGFSRERDRWFRNPAPTLAEQLSDHLNAPELIQAAAWLPLNAFLLLLLMVYYRRQSE